MESHHQATFEQGLVQALEPIRGFALAATLHQFFDSGIYDFLAERGPSTAEQVAVERDLEPDRILVLLQYLTVEGYLENAEGRFTVTSKAIDLVPYIPWYRMLIGGYGNTFLSLNNHLDKGSPPANRDLAMVGDGSCGISHYDAIPLTRRLLDQITPRPRRIVDLGCGNGRYIVELCDAIPGIVARGVEPSYASTVAANDLIAKAGYQDRAQVIHGDAASVLSPDFTFEPQCFILGFVLQEILGQVGREGLTDFVRSLFDRYPMSHVIVIEVDNRHDDLELMRSGLAKAYYNAYYLLHPFTQQRLETRAFWRELFADCGAVILAEDTTDLQVDSTGFELGFLVARAEG
ncbi:hypothetical protein N9D66_01225 [Candidatus Nanopelagicales bacterium]|nr:hypothetical protein [Candidatus Nanopelagicales bacterium]